MKTKEKSILSWSVAIGLIVVVVVGILLGTLLNKGVEAELIITADNIEISVEEKKEIKYESSIKDAVVRFRVTNNKIAELEGNNVIGKTVGETEVIITGRHNSLVYEKRISVVVKGKEEQPSTDKPNSGENTEDNKGEEKPPVSPTVEETEITLSGSGCDIIGNSIEITVGKTARVVVMPKEEFTNFGIKSYTEGISVKESQFSQRMLEIKAEQEGDFEIKLALDNKIGIIKVKVKSN